MKEYSINTITYYANYISIDRNTDFLKNQLSDSVIKNAELYNRIIEVYTDVFNRISGFNLKHLFVTLTQSDSLFFRLISNDNIYEFKLEAFLNYEADNDQDIQATLHIYKNSSKQKSLYGDIDQLCRIIAESLTSVPVYETIFNNSIRTTVKENLGIDGLENEAQLPSTSVAIQRSYTHFNNKFRQHTLLR